MKKTSQSSPYLLFLNYFLPISPVHLRDQPHGTTYHSQVCDVHFHLCSLAHAVFSVKYRLSWLHIGVFPGNSYSCFKIQLRCHLLCEAFLDSLWEKYLNYSTSFNYYLAVLILAKKSRNSSFLYHLSCLLQPFIYLAYFVNTRVQK